jgi:hypothetical protein
MMKINSSQKDWILFRNVTSGNRITFEYFISAEPSYQWWVLYRGVMPDWANLNENKEKWDWVSSNSKTDRKGKVQFDYEFTAGAIYTLALFKDQTENAYDLADYFEFCVPPQDHKLSDRKISGNSTTFYYIVESPSSGISDEQKYQWWVLYRGVMPHWANLNKNKEKWDRAGVAPSRGNSINATEFDYEFTPGAIYTLALFKDQTKDAYELADYMEFCVQPQDDNLSHFKISGNTIEFDYNISAEPSYQWWVLYRGVMPDWANLNENKEKWDWISSNSKTDRQGKVQFDYECTPGAIYTLALFKDQTENAYDLAYYLEFFGSTWIQLHGDNSYCYCACSSDANIKHKHDSYKTMNVIEGAPYFYAVLTEDDDTVDFPTGAVLTIEGPDGTNYDRDIEEENQLVIMSGSSVRCLIIKDPKPGDWKMTMTVPEGVGFHCECNTVPSKDPYKTITTALSKTNQLPKRDLSNDGKSDYLGWYALYAVWLVINLEKDVKENAKAGAIAGGAVGAGVGFVGGPTVPVTVPGGAAIGAAIGAFGGAITGLAQGATAMSRLMTAVAQANAAPPGEVRIATWNVYHGNLANGNDPEQYPRLPRLVDRVNQLVNFGVQNNIGLIAFQEIPRSVWNDPTHEIFTNIRNNSHYAYVIVNGEYPNAPPAPAPASATSDGYLILYNPAVLTVQNIGPNNHPEWQYFQHLEFDQGGSQPRPPVQLQFQNRATGTVFDFLTWHNEAQPAFARTYVETALDLLSRQPGNWILAGDLNINDTNLFRLGVVDPHHLTTDNASLNHIIASGTVINPEVNAAQTPPQPGRFTISSQQWGRFWSDAHYVVFGIIQFP